MDLATAALAGGIAGTLISTYVTAGRDGRTARAGVRERVADTEELRWLDADFAEFRKALTRLEAAAIIAKFDRALIDRYKYLATVAHYQEIRERDADPGLPLRTLPLDLAALLEGTVAMIANEAWRPRFWRFRKKRIVWVVDKAIESCQLRHPEWAWNVTLLKPKPIAQEPGPKAAVRRRLKQLIDGSPVTRAGR